MSAPITRLQDRVAIVTGASRGIGLGIAHRLVEEGAKVCITARTEQTLQEAVAEFPEGTAIYVAGKADDPEHRAEVLDTIASTFGRLDILVNNAGINPSYGPMIEIDETAARKIMEVNVLGELLWTRDAIARPELGFAARGAVVNLSSVTALVPTTGIGYYGVSKAANAQLTKTLAVELAPNIRVNAVAPAVVKTKFARALYEGKEAEVSATYPMQRLGTPEDVAAAVAFLVSDDASWITGQTLVLDGGLLSAGGTA
jgi:NAD(P)-dependent dehydrogenase (short-subunit alcohol dehydrogenase family)